MNYWDPENSLLTNHWKYLVLLTRQLGELWSSVCLSWALTDSEPPLWGGMRADRCFPCRQSVSSAGPFWPDSDSRNLGWRGWGSWQRYWWHWPQRWEGLRWLWKHNGYLALLCLVRSFSGLREELKLAGSDGERGDKQGSSFEQAAHIESSWSLCNR